MISRHWSRLGAKKIAVNTHFLNYSPGSNLISFLNYERGYQVRPNYYIGEQIDIVVESDKYQIVVGLAATNNDPDDIRKHLDGQRLLERVGWQFVYVRSSSIMQIRNNS